VIERRRQLVQRQVRALHSTAIEVQFLHQRVAGALGSSAVDLAGDVQRVDGQSNVLGSHIDSRQVVQLKLTRQQRADDLARIT